jgi:hypothetical protein
MRIGPGRSSYGAFTEQIDGNPTDNADGDDCSSRVPVPQELAAVLATIKVKPFGGRATRGQP